MRKFTDINELVEHLKMNQYVHYQGPMNHSPVAVKVRRYTISNEDYQGHGKTAMAC